MNIKRLFSSLFFLLACASVLAQAPQRMTAQAVLRDGNNKLIANQRVGVRVSIRQGSATGPKVYAETHSPTTNAHGLYTVMVGGGDPLEGNFAAIDWEHGPYFIVTEADPAGGSNYTLQTHQQLVSVPYAFFADTAARVATAHIAIHARVADTAHYYQESQTISLSGDTLYLTDGGSVVLPHRRDTIYIDTIVRDTHYVVTDIVTRDTMVSRDTTYSIQQHEVTSYDTTYTVRYDTIRLYDTTLLVYQHEVSSYDTLYTYDSTYSFDTFVIVRRDTTISFDTFYTLDLPHLFDSIASMVHDSATTLRNEQASVNARLEERIVNDSIVLHRAIADSIARQRTLVSDTATALRQAMRDTVVSVCATCPWPLPDLETVLGVGNSAGTQQIKNLLDPTDLQDAATWKLVLALRDSLSAMKHHYDSIVEGILSCNGRNSVGFDEHSAIGSYTWPLNGVTYTLSTNNAVVVLPRANAAGCDSVVMLRLWIIEPLEGGTCTGTVAVNGLLPGIFSVSNTRTVHFSQGNLQYKASTNSWRFAECQCQYVGSGNGDMSSTYDGWTDLFGFGTSGWNSGASAYQPYSTASIATDYLSYDLTGVNAHADWGIHNAISNGGDVAGRWRTLTKSEWDYLLNTRPASTVGATPDSRYCKAMVDGVNGVILFPDSYIHPSGLASPVGVNSGTTPFSSNNYSVVEWEKLETAGCVFLPASGIRSASVVSNAGATGRYWTSSVGEDGTAYNLNFAFSTLYSANTSDCYIGCAVRLVKE